MQIKKSEIKFTDEFLKKLAEQENAQHLGNGVKITLLELEEGEFTDEQTSIVSRYFDSYGPIDIRFLFDKEKYTLTLNGEGEFFEELMKHIMLGVKIPKVQIERVVGPILGFFIEDIMSSLLDEDIVTISAEFPLRKFENESGTRNNQSTNIDWLMYCREKKELIFVELKTTDTSFSKSQASLYAKVQKEITGKQNALFLQEDIQSIKSSSMESGKYESILGKIKEKSIDFSEIHSSRIIYILPDVVRRTMKEEDKREIEFYSFKELKINANKKNAFRSQWMTLFKHLCELDEITRVSRNRKSLSVAH